MCGLTKFCVIHVSIIVQEPLPDWLLRVTRKLDAMGVFDGHAANHVLINEYLPGQGIMPHEDGPFFYPVIANITLGSHTILDLYENTDLTASPSPQEVQAAQAHALSPRRRIGGLLLEPNSLVIMREDMYRYLHGIDEHAEDRIDDSVLNLHVCNGVTVGSVLQRGTRVSLTIRYTAKSVKLPIGLKFAGIRK